MPTQEEYNVTKQKYRNLYAKIDILNYNFQIVGTLFGSVVGNPSFSNDSTSDIRRTCSIQLYPKDSSFDIKQGGKIWIDKYVQVYIGIYNEDIKDVTYTNMGIYIIDNPSQTYDATQNIITISGLDLMARLTGMRNGNLQGLPYEVPQGSNVKNVLISLIGLFGFTNYIIEDYPIPTPYDINIDVGGFAYDIITEILNILPNYQVYFDVNGVFHFGIIPNGKNEQVRVTDDLWKSVLVSYTRDYNYENIKNYIEVLGKNYDGGDIAYSLGVVTANNNSYEYDSTVSYTYPLDGERFIATFVTPSKLLTKKDGQGVGLYIPTTGQTSVEQMLEGVIYDANGDLPDLQPDTYYTVQGVFNEGRFNSTVVSTTTDNIASVNNKNNVIKVIDSSVKETSLNTNVKTYFKILTTEDMQTDKLYMLKINDLEAFPWNGGKNIKKGVTYYVNFIPPVSGYENYFDHFKFLCETQPYGIAKETNANSPFYINGTSGTLRIVLSGGEYDNINSDQLAQERANFELYKRCRLQDSVTITCVPIYWLDTNWLVSITLPNKNGTETTELYLIKSITTDYGTSSTQTINLMKYYPYYPSI